MKRKVMIKEMVRSILGKGQVLKAIWDAGGDNTICYFELDGAEINDTLYSDVYEQLRRVIIKTLELPNAGERYHEGEGIIQINHANEVVIIVNSKEYYDSYNSQEALIELSVASIEGLKPYIHKIQIHVSGHVSYSREIDVTINVLPSEGDKCKVPKTATAAVREQVKQLLDDTQKKYTPSNPDYSLDCIDIRGNSIGTTSVLLTRNIFEVKTVNKIYENEIIKLEL